MAVRGRHEAAHPRCQRHDSAFPGRHQIPHAPYRGGMPKPELDGRQRAEAARVTAQIDRLAVEGLAGGYLEALPNLRKTCSDRVVLGDVLGDVLYRVVVGAQAETISAWPALDLLRAAGADEERAAAKAAWLRSQAEDSQLATK